MMMRVCEVEEQVEEQVEDQVEEQADFRGWPFFTLWITFLSGRRLKVQVEQHMSERTFMEILAKYLKVHLVQLDLYDSDSMDQPLFSLYSMQCLCELLARGTISELTCIIIPIDAEIAVIRYNTAICR